MQKLFAKRNTQSLIEYEAQWLRASFRESYDSDIAFVEGAMNAYYRVRELQVPIPEWHQLVRILGQFNKDTPMMAQVMAAVDAIVAKNNKPIHEEFSVDDYEKIMDMVLTFVR